MNKIKKILFLNLAVLLVFGFIDLHCFAADDVEIHVTAIMASQSSTFIDPELKVLAGELQSTFAFSSYQKLKRYTVLLSESQSDRIILPQNNPLAVTYKSISDDGRIHLRLEMSDIFNADCSLNDGGHLLVGGPQYDDGNLILLIEVTK
jgi:hypothetical protein